MVDDSKHSPAALRNREFIRAELSQWIGRLSRKEGDVQNGHLLEISSGSGCHVAWCAERISTWFFKPTEYDEPSLALLREVIHDLAIQNILEPEQLDVTLAPSSWPRPAAQADEQSQEPAKLWDAMMCINMIHIAPKECTHGLMAGAGENLRLGGRLFMYGPYVLDGLLTPDSNRKFDESLKARSNGSWGIRDIKWVAEAAHAHGLELTSMKPLPANNFFVVFTKVRNVGETTDGTEGLQEQAASAAQQVADVVLPIKAALARSTGPLGQAS